ncbi:MAG: NAD-dependent epimerase/dehydratase family protein [Massilia sp.]
MNQNILVLGGTRFFGKLLVQRLLRAGHRVTIATRGYAPDPFGSRIARIRVDRRNDHAMHAAFRAANYDLVIDQMCYSPLDAAIAVRSFAGKVGRYVMTSTIDVYRVLPASEAPLREADLNVLAQPIDTQYPWHDPSLATQSYVAGKLQAEAYLYRDGSLPLVTARLAHVLGGPEDFTGRVAYYVDLVRQRAPLRYSNPQAALSFMEAQAAADFVAWAGMQDFTGPVNAASAGPLSALALYERVAQVLDEPGLARRAAAARPGQLSPFDSSSAMVLDTGRAAGLGYRFDHTEEWLDDVIRQHDLAFV